MKFLILHPYGAEKNRWASLINYLNLQDRDIHFIPEYGTIYQRTYGQEPFLAFYGDESRYVVQPFVKRLLNELPFLKDQNITEPYFDISNPYGYGGPVFCCKSREEKLALYRDFNEHLTRYCEEEKIASEFTSLHPFLRSHEVLQSSGLVELIKSKEVVYLDLTLSQEKLLAGLNRGHRSSINKARKHGIIIDKVECLPENFRIFNRLYNQTMERNHAAQRWFLPDDYFQNCFEQLGPRRVSLFFASVNNEVASAYFLMHDFSNAYYHFGGSDERFYDLRPNNLLMFEIALWLKQQGYLRYHLGGGVSSATDDSLLRYKMGFSDKRAKLYTYGRVHHVGTYEHLCSLKIDYEKSMFGTTIQSDFFPLYRR